MENNGIFDVLDESYPALKIGFCASVAINGYVRRKALEERSNN